MRVTLTVIKGDVGSIGGHTRPSDLLLSTVKKYVDDNKSLLIDYHVGYNGDDVNVLMSHEHGINSVEIHTMAREAFLKGTEIAKSQGLYGAGQDILSDAFAGNVRGTGLGVAEMEFEERPAENFILFTADKTEPGAFNLPLYSIFCDPMKNTGIYLNRKLRKGVKVTCVDVKDSMAIKLYTPEGYLDIGEFLMFPARHVVKSVHMRESNEPVVAATTDRLSYIAGKYVGKDDPAMIFRVQKDFPATEEVCRAFSAAHYVAGNTRGSHHMPLMPVAINSPASTNYCIPMVSSALYSMKNGKFVGPLDGFGDESWDGVRKKALEKAESIREQGFFYPATLGPDELEYNEGFKEFMESLKTRLVKV